MNRGEEPLAAGCSPIGSGRSRHEPASTSTDSVAAAQGAGSIFVLQSVGRVLSLAFVLVVTRAVSATEFGRYSLAAALVLLATTVFDLGLTPTITQEVSSGRQQSEALLTDTIVGSALLGFLGYLAMLIFGILASYPSQTLADLAIAGLAIPGSSISSSVLATLDGSRLIARRAVITLVQTAIVALGGAALAVSGTGARGALLALAVGPWVALALGRSAARSHGIWAGRVRLHLAPAASLVRRALPLALASCIGVLLMRMDVVFLSLLTDPAVTAVYDIARRLIESLAYVSSAVTVPTLVVLSARMNGADSARCKAIFCEAVRVVTLAGLPLSIILALSAVPLVDTIFGPQFAPTSIPVAILGAGVWILFVTQVQTVVFVAGRRLRPAIALAAANLTIVIVLDLALIGRYGATGAAVATLTGWVVMVVAGDRCLRRSFGLATPLPSLRLLFCGLATGGVLLLTESSVGLAAVPLAIFVYVAGILLTGVLDRADLCRYWTLVRSRPLLSGSSTGVGDPSAALPLAINTASAQASRPVHGA